MPRVMRVVHEYYDNRVVHGFNFSVSPDGLKLIIGAGLASVNRQLVEIATVTELPASSFIAVGGNKAKYRTDLVVLNTNGTITVVRGADGTVIAPKCPDLAMVLAQVTIGQGWFKFVGVGADDEVICVRSQHVIDTRFEPISPP